MGKVLGLTKNNDQYEDVPDELKWAIPLHEHLTSPKMQKWFDERKAQSEQRVEKELSNLQREASKKRLKILTLES
ncbi:MAG: hypothetical protein K1X29_08235 [Bdellovibrionales bacterium]|nr:hypothetical protein [Bdellovibrionales bacterium]